MMTASLNYHDVEFDDDFSQSEATSAITCWTERSEDARQQKSCQRSSLHSTCSASASYYSNSFDKYYLTMEQHPQHSPQRAKSTTTTKPRVRATKAHSGRRRQRTNRIRSMSYEDNASIAADTRDESSVVSSSSSQRQMPCFPTYCDVCGFWDQEDLESLGTERSPTNLELVFVAVEATSLGGRGIPQVDVDRSSLQCHFVGVVHHCSAEATDYFNIQKGDRVTSIHTWNANAHFVSVPPQHLLVVPKSIDAAELASLMSFHVPAFQALHHGRSRPQRYQPSMTQSKNVLIVAASVTLEVQAMVQLAWLGGATRVFVAAPRSQFGVLRNLQVEELGDILDEWIPFVKRRMDLVVHCNFPKNLKWVRQALVPNGRLVCCPPKKALEETSFLGSEWDYLLERYQLTTMKRASLFQYNEYIAQFERLVKQDVMFLVDELKKRKIRPYVHRIISLGEIEHAKKYILSPNPLDGAIICEPWK